MADKQIADIGNCITESTGKVVSCVKKKDIKKASSNLKDIKSDAEIIIKKLKLRVEQLESVVKLNSHNEREIIEKQYQAEHERESLQRENDEIADKMEQCKKAKASAEKSLKQSQCLFNSAEAESRESGQKAQELRDNWFVPFYGQYLLIREAVQQNGQKEEEAKREAERHKRNCTSLEREIDSYENELKVISNKIYDNQRAIKALSDQCHKLHRLKGDLRNAIDDLKQTIFYREEQNSIALEGLKNTESLDKKLKKAIGFKAKLRNKFCKSKATTHSVELFDATWKSLLTVEHVSNISISFTCTNCRCFKTDIPFYDEYNESFTCGDCYEKQYT